MNLIEALQDANQKSRDFLVELDETAALLHGAGKTARDDPGLAISAAATRHLIRQAEDAIASGDVVKMIAAARAHGIGEADVDAG